MQGVVRTPRQLNNSALNQWLNQSVSETSITSGTTDCVADPVGRWMQDVRVMIEPECMCVLQAKTFQSSAVDMAKLSRHKKLNIIRLRQQVCGISADFVNFYNNLDSTDLKDIRKLAIRLTNQIEKLVRNCLDFLYAQSVPFSISEKQEQVRRQSSMLLCHIENFIREGSFGTGVVPVLKTLSSLGHAFAGLAETIQSNLVRSLLEDIQGSASMYHLRVALQSLQSLTTDYKEISNIIIKEDGLQILCQICSINNVDAMKVDALRTIAVLCETQEARIEFEKANGIPVLADLLSSESSIEVKAEVARILAQITSPHVDSIHHFIGFIEYLDDLLRELTDLCKLAPSPSVFMVATAAISNITFMDSMSCDYLATYNTAEALLSGCKSGKADSLYCKDQIATTLANMVSSKACRQQVIDADGVGVLLSLLDEAVLPLKSINQEDLRRMHQLCESVQQKALIALGRLAQTKTSAMVITEMQGAKRLADLCYNSLERNNSDSVLLASLVALRRLFQFDTSSGLDDMVIEQLIKPRITDSFLFCSKEKESFV